MCTWLENYDYRRHYKFTITRWDYKKLFAPALVTLCPAQGDDHARYYHH
jgi:hypothetical protein